MSDIVCSLPFFFVVSSVCDDTVVERIRVFVVDDFDFKYGVCVVKRHIAYVVFDGFCAGFVSVKFDD